ncbi:MAG: type II 3-dehydroquinate dehydratase [Burkholderiales bacterium]|jgi:3-dehydroquinate dehydratase-2|nr:type II 3-dehydroquinate dehydratase [Betaproteobacteria bacterium]NBT99742.1 type II 3-dehydroquinate dehydratase [Betaproteobacteria bacterium]NCX02369.1 type II 3-dehydroquinate dehydratase [Betaproteobacteria bacterium]NDE32491.1 type II 3-dehydroquinate dehydratase [Betaproteobacteria bacterium]
MNESPNPKVLCLQGANMEYLGIRQPEIYGTTDLQTLHAMLLDEAKGLGIDLDIRVSNLEGEAIGWIYECDRAGYAGLLMNPAGFSYAGYALRDCLRGIRMPAVEVHMSNIERRAMKSVTAEACVGVVTGFGLRSYFHGLRALSERLKT